MTVNLRTDPPKKLIYANLDAWFAALDRFSDIPFMEDGREQAPMPEDKDSTSYPGKSRDRTYRPVNLGARFSINAVIPSALSSKAKSE
jgi:hypothetical protein